MILLVSNELARTVEGIGRAEWRSSERGSIMLHYAVVFLLIALVAAVLGFGGLAGAATGIAKILFLVFLVLFIASMVFGRRARL